MVRTTVRVDGALMDALHTQILAIERQINALVPEHDPIAVHVLRTIPGVGKILALVIFYEIHDINRFPKVGNFISYARLVKCAHESAGKRRTGKNSKIGNAKALSIIAQKLGRTVYSMLKRRTPFDAKLFFETVR
jgi:transposase